MAELGRKLKISGEHRNRHLTISLTESEYQQFFNARQLYRENHNEYSSFADVIMYLIS